MQIYFTKFCCQFSLRKGVLYILWGLIAIGLYKILCLFFPVIPEFPTYCVKLPFQIIMDLIISFVSVFNLFQVHFRKGYWLQVQGFFMFVVTLLWFCFYFFILGLFTYVTTFTTIQSFIVSTGYIAFSLNIWSLGCVYVDKKKVKLMQQQSQSDLEAPLLSDVQDFREIICNKCAETTDTLKNRFKRDFKEFKEGVGRDTTEYIKTEGKKYGEQLMQKTGEVVKSAANDAIQRAIAPQQNPQQNPQEIPQQNYAQPVPQQQN